MCDTCKSGPDLTVQNEGTIYIIHAASEDRKPGLADSVDHGDYNPYGENGRLVEHRYIADIVAGALADGLCVQ